MTAEVMAVAIIPARGGSRRIPRKNIRPFHGKPILAYSIEAANESGLFNAVYVSSEDQEILRIAEQYGAHGIERETKYAYDDVGTQTVMADALVEIEMLGVKPHVACCIYATAPLLRDSDLRYGYELFMRSLYYRYVYVNGWYYWGSPEDFSQRPEIKYSLELDQVVGSRYIDINTEEDWQRAEQMYMALEEAKA